MVSKQFYQDIDMVNVGQLIGTRHQNVNNADMTAMVTLLGSNNKGLVVWNTDQNKEFVWDGTSFIPHETIQNASTTQAGVVQLNDNINSTSTTEAATANAVKKAYDIGNNKLPLTGGTLTGALNGTSAVFSSSVQVGNGIHSASAVSFLNGGASQNINTGGVLASNDYADASKVPTNGIYSKGKVHTATAVEIGSSVDGAKDTDYVRAVIHPPTHTGGDWEHTVRDDATYAYYKLGYGTSGYLQLRSDGVLIASGGFSGNAATATKLQTARTINGTSFDGSANITINAVDSTARIAMSEKGAASGVATLDASGKIPLTQLNDAILGQVQFIDLWNAATNTPTLPATPTKKGDYYIVSVGGTRFGLTFEVGDWIIANGEAWGKVDNTDAVSSVAGRTGNITLTTSDIGGLGNVALINTNGSTANFLRGDGKWINPPNTTYTEISEAEISAGTASTLRTITGRRMKFALDTKADATHGHDIATTSVNGFMSSSDKSKLDGIAAGAQVNVPTNLSYTAASTTGTVVSSTGSNVTLPAATTSNAGLMTNTDKVKLDDIAQRIADLPAKVDAAAASATAANEDLYKFVTDEVSSSITTTLGNIPTLTQWARDREIVVTKGSIPKNYVSGPLRLEVDGGITEQEFVPVDSYVPRAGDEVFAIGETIVGVLASKEPLMESFCKYYGYPMSINSYWDREKAAQFFAKFHGVVWGDNMGEPTHEANADNVAIAARIKELNPTIKIFGYVPIGMDPAWPDSNLPLEALYTKIDNWKATGATHIFLDEYGYDYYVTRDRQNALVQYCHNLGMNVCANSWSSNYCFSNRNIILHWANNFEGNPNLLPSLLTDQDYLQFENVLYKYHHEPGQASELRPEQWVNDNQRISDMYNYMYEPQEEFGGQSYYDVYGTRGYALDAIIDYDQKMYDESYLVALALGMHAHAASIAFWGAVANTYHTYDTPTIRAASRVALGKAVPSTFANTYMGRVTTQVGPDQIEITWVQDQEEIAFTEASIVQGLEPKKHILAVEIPPGVTAVGQGWFTVTLGDASDDARGVSFAIEGTETQQQLLDKIANYSYHPDFLAIYEVIREQDRVIFQTLEPYTEELETWWVWHTAGALTETISSFTLIQKGTDGMSVEYREVRVNGVAMDQGFGPYWRKPRLVKSGYVYFDTTHNRNIIFRAGKWYDMQGNLADDFIDTGSIPSMTIVMYGDQTLALPTGWVWCDGTNGAPNIPANPYPYIMKK